MMRTVVFACILGLIWSGCKESVRKKKTTIDFRSLTEDQKRLSRVALSSMTVADGLQVELFAAEPMVTNPTNISVDEKGRVWVCEAYNYDVAPEEKDANGDRIIVLEDTDHDGKADKRTVFYQGEDINTPLGIMAAGNKVYVSRSPNLIVFSDTNGDLVADRKDTLLTNMGTRGDHSAHAVFSGPDGKFYFSTGNRAGDIEDRNGNAIRERSGSAIAQKGKPFLGGMVMRFNTDLSGFEVLGHNFRNNYEPCIDSYGNVWQSDNDDDGNASCRVNFVMPYGNYGYLDEFSKASWTTNRVNQEATVPERHWHQGDPGVVPNVLITGAGSPAGMTMYEGDQLPKEFYGMPIHAEPYYNVVRSYLTKKSGAGYTATIANILKSSDQWFRPVDVATAPDGSLIVADWYDPVLGGSAAGDAVKGRIYRVAKNTHEYRLPIADYSTVAAAITALKNPNPETRWLAFSKLEKQGDKAIHDLDALWHSGNDVYRARAFWLLAKTTQGDQYLNVALKDKSEEIRKAAVRAVVELKQDPIPFLTLVVNDPDVQVRREVATALRYCSTPGAAALWVELAKQYDGQDKWYLEALGIGADLHAAIFFDAWVSSVKPDLNNKAHRDIIWRSRSPKTLNWLVELVKRTKDGTERLRYFRAFDFDSSKQKTQALTGLIGLNRIDAADIDALALQQMNGDDVIMTSTIRKALDRALEKTRGTIAFVDLVEKFKLQSRRDDLLELAINHGSDNIGSAAAKLLLDFHEANFLSKSLRTRNDTATIGILQSLKGKSDKQVTAMITNVINDQSRDISVRQSAIQTLGSTWPGEEVLLAQVRNRNFPELLKPAAAGVLFTVYRSGIQREAAKYLTSPNANGAKLPSIKQLLAADGDAGHGGKIFTTYCISCHRVKTQGVKFGPELTQIGTKLSKEGIYKSVIFPDDGISYGYESYLITTNDGAQSVGIISSETDNEITLAQPGGITIKIAKPQVKQRTKNAHSIMPSLASTMSQQDLIDLVTFLSGLK